MDNPYVQYMYSYPHKTAYGPLSGIRLEDYIQRLVGAQNSLYFHIPFCQSKCGYCNLFSVAGCGKSQMDAYLDVLPRQIGQYREILPESTVFGDFTIGAGGAAEDYSSRGGRFFGSDTGRWDAATALRKTASAGFFYSQRPDGI